MPEEEKESKKEIKEEEMKPLEEIEEKSVKEIPFHKHNGMDGSPRIDARDIKNLTAGGKLINVVVKADSFSTTSNSFVDVTDLTITANLNNKRVLLLFFSTIYNSAEGGNLCLTFRQDTTDLGGTNGLIWAQFVHQTINTFMPASMGYVTDKLSGSHTFKVRLKSDGNTSYINYGGNARAIFIAIELN